MQSLMKEEEDVKRVYIFDHFSHNKIFRWIGIICMYICEAYVQCYPLQILVFAADLSFLQFHFSVFKNTIMTVNISCSSSTSLCQPAWLSCNNCVLFFAFSLCDLFTYFRIVLFLLFTDLFPCQLYLVSGTLTALFFCAVFQFVFYVFSSQCFLLTIFRMEQKANFSIITFPPGFLRTIHQIFLYLPSRPSS